MADGSSETTWSYDQRGRVLATTQAITGTGTFTTSSSYNAVDRVRTITHPDNDW